MEETKEIKKLSYEELEKVAQELHAKCSQLYAELQRMSVDNTFKRLDYLFKVVKYEDMFPEYFTKKCIEEIVDVMTIPEETTEEA
jgi:hypothetical protein